MLTQKTPLKRRTPLKAKTQLKKTAIRSTGSTLKVKQKTARKRTAAYWSIFTEDLTICQITGCPNAVPHHVFGNAYKLRSEERGFILPLRSDWHTVSDYSIHQDKSLDLKYKVICEKYYLSHYGTKEDFIKEFGKDYICVA